MAGWRLEGGGEECGSEPEMIPRSKSFSLTLPDLDLHFPPAAAKLMEDNKDIMVMMVSIDL